jgi:hypothetical protein
MFVFNIYPITGPFTLTPPTRILIYTQAGKFLTQNPTPPLPQGTNLPVIKLLAHDALLLGDLFSFIMKPILGGVDGSGTACDLRDALVASAAAGIILFIIFYTQEGAFIPAQLYHDFQSTIKALFIDVTRQMLESGRADMNFLLGTNELEKLFGILRSLFTGRGFDLKELGERIGATIDIHGIKQRRSHWDRGQRRLSVAGSYDRANLISWLGKMFLEGTGGVVQSSYIQGVELGLASCERHPFYGGEDGEGVTRARSIVRKAQAEGCTLMRLFDGKLVGVGMMKGNGEWEEDEEQQLLRASRSTGDDEGGVIDPLPEEVADVLAGMDVDLTDSRGDDVAAAAALLRAEGMRGGEDPAIGRLRTDRVRVEVEGEDEGTFISKAAALASLGVKYMVQGFVKSTERLRRVCGMAKSNTTSSSSGMLVMEEDTAYVQIFDPVVVFIKTDSDSDKQHNYVTMSMAVGSIATMSNKTVGSGPLILMPEHAFATEETKVEVNLVRVSAAAGGDDFFELHTDHFLTVKPLIFKGNEFVLLVKPQVVENGFLPFACALVFPLCLCNGACSHEGGSLSNHPHTHTCTHTHNKRILQY